MTTTGKDVLDDFFRDRVHEVIDDWDWDFGRLMTGETALLFKMDDDGRVTVEQVDILEKRR